MHTRHHTIAAIASTLLIAAISPTLAIAQQAINTEATPQPGKGRFAIRETLRITSYSDDPTDQDRDITDFNITSNVVYGITGNFAVSLSVPIVFRDTRFDGPESDDTEGGFADIPLLFRWRIWQDDTGAVDTRRLVLLGGVEIPSGDDPFTSDSLDPMIGAVFSMISGRHGFNTSLQWKFTTGENEDPVGPGESLSDLLRYEGAYLFRLAPEQYAADTHASIYLTGELVGLYETSGDHEILLAPGLLYEATTWAAEISVQLPVLSELDERFKRDWIVTIGFRLLF